jgi:hypothetical protein
MQVAAHEWVYMHPNNFSVKNLGVSEVLEDIILDTVGFMLKMTKLY